MKRHSRIKWMTLAVSGLMMIGFQRVATADTTSSTSSTTSSTDAVDSIPVGTKVFAYGEDQNTTELATVKKALGIADDTSIKEVAVSKTDMESYVGSMPNVVGVWSSAVVTKEKEGAGITVNIKTPNNITQVTSLQYTNAIISAGGKDVTVDIASAVESLGQGALAGSLIALQDLGFNLDKEATEAAQTELETTSQIAADNASDDSFDDTAFNQAIAETKLEVSKLPADEVTEEKVKEIVEDTMNEYSVPVDSTQINNIVTMVINLYNSGAFNSDSFKDSINSFLDKGKELLNTDAAKDAVNKGKEALNSDEAKGFFAKVFDAIKSLFSKIANFFTGNSDSGTTTSGVIVLG